MGPVISSKHRERVVSYIEKGVAEGAKLVLDGRNLRVPEREKGFFLGPTVFDGVAPSMSIGREEIDVIAPAVERSRREGRTSGRTHLAP